MPLSHLVVIPCPNGKTAGGKGRLSVYLAPRLRENGMLSDYTEWRDWADFVLGPPALSFTVELDGVALLPAAVTIVSGPPDRAVWRNLFGYPGLPQPDVVEVKAFEYLERSDADFHTLSSKAMADLVESAYKAMAALGSTPVTKATAGGLLSAGQSTIDATLDYMAPVGNGQLPDGPTFEFHEVLRYLRAHPYLLRKLGLVFDLELTLPAGTFANVAVKTNWAARTGARPKDEVPLRMQVDANFDGLVSEQTYRKGRWLTLGGSRYAVTQVNVLKSAISLDELNRTLAATASTTDAVEVPAVEDAGISVLHTNVLPKLLDDLERQRTVEDGVDDYITGLSSATPLLFAEDVTSGTRFDVNTIVTKPTLRSLHQRRVPSGYQFPRNGLVVSPPDDEGWSSPALFTDGKSHSSGNPSSVVYPVQEGDDVAKKERTDDTSWRVDDHLMTWSGWSLSAPRPGKILDSAGEPLARTANQAEAGYAAQVTVNYVPVPLTLPRLRYSLTYKFRGRCVDLAGNSRSLTESAPNSDAISLPITYGRMNPVVAPTILRRSSRPDPGVGDLTDVIVIRSELTQSDASTPKSDRLLFPPTVSQNRLERHGLPPADGIDAGDYTAIATRDAATLAGQVLQDPETGELVAGTAVISNAVSAGPLKQKATYFPDPVGDGVALHGLPKSTKPVIMKMGTWPDYESVLLELKAGSSKPTTSAAQRRVTVALPKGTTAHIEISSTIASKYLAHMKFFQLLSKAQQTANKTAIQKGLDALFSPRRAVTLVHAVRVPLAAPAFVSMTGSRSQVGQTTVAMNGTVGVHRATSERLVLRAQWTDPIDDLALAQPSDSTHRALAADLDLGHGVSGTQATVAGETFDLGDTKRHFVTLKAEAFCSYSSYFTEQKDWSSTQGSGFVLNAGGVADGSVVVTNRNTGDRYEQGTNYRLNQATGTVTPRIGGGIPNGTPLRALYIPLPVSRVSAEAAKNKTISFAVPASARPAPPSVSHVLPAFARTSAQTSTKITVGHDGRVIRVFLNRPWYSSGVGELLGVALDSAGVVTPVFTQWGRDALAAGPGPTLRPTTAAFKKAIGSATNVDGTFDVAAHTVTYDVARGLWFADVQVDATFGYRPFVQLYVCRYQPLAVAGEHVSSTVDCEILRLGAPRVVTVTRKPAHNVEVKLAGPDRVNTVTVTLQDADPAITDADLRWRDVGAPVVLARTGSLSAAVHTGLVPTPLTGNLRRLLIEDAEPVTHESAGVLVDSTEVAYREVVTLPAAW